MTQTGVTDGSEAKVAEPPPWVKWALPVFVMVIVGGYAISCVLAISGTSETSTTEVLLDNGVSWLIGSFMIGAAIPHIIMPAATAHGIGWEPSPFQWEVGWADLSIGVLGLMASNGPRELVLAAVVVFAIFNYAAVVGHVRDALTRRNFSPGNFGVMFVYSIVAPAWLMGLYVVTS